jgi:putative acetyltransferase
MGVTIRADVASDRRAIGEVHRLAFATADEAELVDALRDAGLATTSLVAQQDAAIVGHILFSHVSIVSHDRKWTAVSLAPMAVLPSHQGQGIGGELVRRGLQWCQGQGERIAVVLGHPTYYPRFGFSAELACPLVSPFGGGDAWMALELVPGSLAGVAGQVQYPPPFERFL